MTGDSDVTRCDWLQQARIEISSNTIIFHDETFVKMVTVEDILNRLSEERQRCYRAHSDAEMRQQESDPCIENGCDDIDSCDEICEHNRIYSPAWVKKHDVAIREGERKRLLDILIPLLPEEQMTSIDGELGVLRLKEFAESLRSATPPTVNAEKKIIEVSEECGIFYSDGSHELCKHAPKGSVFQECGPGYGPHGDCPKWDFHHRIVKGGDPQ